MTTAAPIRVVRGVAVAAILVVTPACYTLFSHPRLVRLNYARPDSDHCIPCHSPRELWTWAHERAARTDGDAWTRYYQRIGRINRLAPRDTVHSLLRGTRPDSLVQNAGPISR